MIKRAVFEAYRRKSEARVEAAENRVRELKSGLQLIDTYIRYALTENDPGIKQWFLWHIAYTLWMSESEIEADFGVVPAPSHPIWLAFAELASDSKQPRPFIIREEEHPLKPGKSIFRVYAENMQPLYIGRETVEEAKIELRRYECISSLTILYRKPFPVFEEM